MAKCCEMGLQGELSLYFFIFEKTSQDCPSVCLSRSARSCGRLRLPGVQVEGSRAAGASWVHLSAGIPRLVQYGAAQALMNVVISVRGTYGLPFILSYSDLCPEHTSRHQVL